jgi:hypothetical protein
MDAVQPTSSGVVVPALAHVDPRATQEIPEADLRSAPLVTDAERLIEQARGALPVDQQALAEHINRCFEQMAERGGSRATADFILRQLDGGRLADLVDGAQRSSRAVAAQALLALGYPYALELSPEDLDHLRREEQRARRPSVAPFIVGAVAAASSVSMASYSAGGAWTGAGALAAGLCAGGALLSWSRVGTRLRALAVGLLAAVTLGAGIAVLVNPSNAVIAGGAAVCLVLAARRAKT